MRPSSPATRIAFLGALLVCGALLAGCGRRIASGTDLPVPLPSPVSGDPGPAAPTGRSDPWNSPVLGGSTRTDTPPPDLVQKATPPAPAQFDSDVQAVLKRYNATIGGPWATPEYVQFVLKSMQLYPALRTHPLRIIVGPDPSRPGLSGFWTTSGGRATIYLYDPKMLSTPAHEIAHDQTNLVQAREARPLKALYGRVPASAYPRQYSRSDELEFSADALSYWARRVAGMASSRENYQPPAEVLQAIQPMLVEALRSK